jgi:hypothetical protein
LGMYAFCNTAESMPGLAEAVATQAASYTRQQPPSAPTRCERQLLSLIATAVLAGCQAPILTVLNGLTRLRCIDTMGVGENMHRLWVARCMVKQVLHMGDAEHSSSPINSSGDIESAPKRSPPTHGNRT